jgi:hypothetical protein
MKTLFLLCLITAPFLAQAQVWQERFNGLADGSTSDVGTTAWTTTLPSGGASSFSKQTPAVGYELFVLNNTTNEGVWQSAVVDISTYSEIAIEITLYSYYTYSSDYIRCYYKLNGGAEIQFGELYGSNGLNITSAASAFVTGTTLQIIVKGMDNTSGTTSGVINGMAFDDVTMTSLTPLYSRTSGNWNNTNSWSTTGFTGASCSCTPGTSSKVIIGNNNNISIPAAATAAGVVVQNTGKLQFTGSTSLTMARGGTITVDNGGQLNNNGGNGNIIYGAYSYSAVINGALSISTITANTGSNINFTGSGTLATNDFNINSGNGRNITFNISGGVTISNDLYFQTLSSNTTLTNNQPLTIGNRLVFASNNVSVINGSSVTAGNMLVNANSNNNNSFTNNTSSSFTVGAIDLTNGDFTFDNYGTVNQTGNFSNIDTGSAFRNRDGSTWNLSGGGTNTRLFCNYGTNTFNYNAAGNQNILAPADNYINLSLTGSGIKTQTSNLDINGNLTIGGTAQGDISASLYTINLAGNWIITSSNANPFVERTGTLIFDGTSNQTIATALGNESFYNLTIDKTNGNVIQSSTDVTVANILSLTNGGMSINGKILNITNSNTGAITRSNGYIISETTASPYSQLKWSIGIGTGTYVFPFGKSNLATDYIPFTFNVTTGGSPAAGTVSVMTYSTPADNTPWPSGVTNLNHITGTNNSAKVTDRFWYITLSGYTTNPYSTVTFVSTPQEVGTITNLRAQRWNATTNKWDPPKSGQANPTNYSVTVPGVNTFSPWTLSEEDAPMPIKLTSFNAMVNNNVVDLTWMTTQEINNDYFTIAKSIDEEAFEELIKIKGAGTSYESNHYKTTDISPTEGKSYYRLKQTDFDGRVTYYKPVMIEYHYLHNGMKAYPLPFDGNEITIELSDMKPNAETHMEILNTSGQKVFKKNIVSDSNGNFREKILFINPLPAGFYYLKADGYLKLIVN